MTIVVVMLLARLRVSHRAVRYSGMTPAGRAYDAGDRHFYATSSGRSPFLLTLDKMEYAISTAPSGKTAKAILPSTHSASISKP